MPDYTESDFSSKMNLQDIEHEECFPTQAYDYFIPGEIASLPISNDVKYFYAFLRNLCNSNHQKQWKGCTWVKNAFLAKNMNISIRTAQRYLNELVQHSAIVIELFENKEWGIKRCIWLSGGYDNFQKFQSQARKFVPKTTLFKKFHNHDTAVTPPCQACHPPMSQMSCIKIGKDKDIKEKEKNMSEPSSGLATSFFDQLKSINPKIKPPNLEKWVDEFDRMMRIDKHSIEDIKKVIAYLISTHEKPSNNGFRWSNVVLSPEKLRQKFAQLWAEMNTPKSENGSKNSEIVEKENRILAEKIWNRFKASQTDISLSAKYIEFINGFNAPSVCLEFSSKDFRMKTMEQLRKRRLDVEGL